MTLNRLATGTSVSRSRPELAAMLLVMVAAAALWPAVRVQVSTANSIAGAPLDRAPSGAGLNPQSQLRALYSQMPLIFEANQGQSDSRVKFLSHGAGYGLFLTANEAVLQMQTGVLSEVERRSHGRRQDAGATSVVRMKLAGANPAAKVIGDDQLPGKSNYFIGNDLAKWQHNVSQFARVRYHNIYCGIDLVYYGKQGQLEYDFQVAPGADPGQVVLSFAGADKLALNSDGELVLATHGGSIRLQAPKIYQKREKEEQPVPGRFVVLADNRVGFEIGAYDRSRELIIDPVLGYSTYLGGTGNEGCFLITGVTSGCPAIAVDPGGFIYVAGSTTSSTAFPTTTGVVQPNLASGATANVFVTKFSPSGAAPLVFSTYLGGNGRDTSAGIAVDSGFNVYVAGTTSSSNFPMASPANGFQTGPPPIAGNHVFVSQLKPDGTVLLYSTYLYGSGTDLATGLAIDNKGDAFVMGTTTSTDFPVVPKPGALQVTSLATKQFFVSEVSTNSTKSGSASLVYSTYFGGGNPSNGAADGGGIAVDANGNIYITGGTSFTHTGAANDFPIVNAFQASLNVGSPENAFVAKINPNLSGNAQLLYSTYLGGTGTDIGRGIAVDSGFNTYVTGSTTSTDVLTKNPLPSGITPFQNMNGGAKDAFVAKIGNPASGSTTFPLNYFTYLGGTADDVGLAIAVDAIQNVRLSGSTSSADFPITPNPSTVQPGGFGGVVDAFVARIDTTTATSSKAGEWATFLGGSANDDATGVAVDVNGNTYVAGDTASSNFPTASPFQASLSGTSDIFISKLVGVSTLSFPASSTTPNPAVSPNPGAVGNQVTFTYTVVNNGPDTANNVIFADTLPSTGNATFSSATAASGSCVPQPVNSVETCVIGTLAPGTTAPATVKIVLTPTTIGTLGNSASVTANGSSTTVSASGTVMVTDFLISVSPLSTTVTAGAPASYTVTLTPEPTYSAQISLSCTGLPTGATCAFSTTPVTIPNTSPVTSALTINTTARPVTTAGVRPQSSPRYGTWLPVSGLVLLGLGIGSTKSRRRRVLVVLLFGGVLSLILLQPACSSSKSTTPTTGGTPAGTYAVTVTGSSGSASHSTPVTLIVQ